MKAFASLLFVLTGCVSSTHATRPSTLGVAGASNSMLAPVTGAVTLETVVSCDWAVSRAGLINLSHPAAKAAGLVDGDEPIEVFFHVIRHPSRGVFLVDSGVERALRDAPEQAAVRGLVADVLHFEKMKFVTPLGDWLAAHPQKVEGLFLTHLHVDHLSGIPDLPKGTPLYTGPGETGLRSFNNLALQANFDRALQGFGPLEEWVFSPDPSGRFEGVLDVFGDGLVWAILVPGHTPGSVAFLLRTDTGPVLLTGDVSHTRWGWEHAVEPGTFTDDHARNAQSLERLRAFVAEHPEVEVRLGHQR